MRFCTRALLFGVLAGGFLTSFFLCPVHSARAQVNSANATEKSQNEGQTPRNDVGDKDRPDRFMQFLRLMEEETTFDFFETPLNEIASEISQRLNVNVILDHRALEDLAIDDSEPMTIEIRNVRLETALDMLLRPHDLDYGFQDNVLLISTVEASETQLQTRVYDVRDLLNADQPWRSLDLLIEVIVGSIAPDSWEELGGNGTIQAYQGNLIVLQTWRQQREIIRLLKTLRKNIQAMGGPNMPLPPSAANTQNNSGGGGFGGGGFFQVNDAAGRRDQATDKDGPDRAKVANPFEESDREIERGIDRAQDETRGESRSHVQLEQKEPKEIDLRRRITLDFKRVPLVEAMDAIAAKCEFGWTEDKRALEEVGCESTSPITFHAQNMTLEKALKLLLGELDLSYVLIDGSLRLTTQECVDAELITRYYNARPLLNSQNPDGSLIQLIELLTATVEPDSWDQLGGHGTIGEYEGILIVASTRFVHEKIDAFLGDLSDALAQAGGVEFVKPPASEVGSGRRERGRNRR